MSEGVFFECPDGHKTLVPAYAQMEWVFCGARILDGPGDDGMVKYHYCRKGARRCDG